MSFHSYSGQPATAALSEPPSPRILGSTGGVGTRDWRWFMDSATLPMLIVDRQGGILHANAAVERLFGYRRRELFRMPVSELLTPRMDESEPGHAPNETTPLLQGYFLGRTRDEARFSAELSTSPLLGGSSLVTIHRRREEPGLALPSAGLAEPLFAELDQALAVLDADFRVVSANPAFLNLLRLRREEVYGHSLLALKNRRWDEAILRRLLGGRLPQEGTFEFGEPERIGRVLSLKASEIGGKGNPRKPRMILLAAEDITEQARTQGEQTRAIHELGRANDELTKFAQVIAHDLKAPLRGIATLADWIASDQKERLDDRGRRHLELLVRRVQCLDAFVAGLMDWARPGPDEEAVLPVDLNTLVREVIESLMPPPHISVSVAGRLPLLCLHWPRIQQVFQNLLENAIRFMDKPEGVVQIDCTDEGPDWKFSVSDNGPGIDPRHAERIFQLFHTLNPHGSPESTGIGLAIAKKIIEEHTGRIWVESEPGLGSRFFFTLPKTATPPVGTTASTV
jgi:two-component system sensor kinase FixL